MRVANLMIVGGPHHGQIFDGTWLVGDGMKMPDNMRRAGSPMTTYTRRRINLPNHRFVVECLSPEKLSDDDVMEIVKAKGMLLALSRRVSDYWG